MPLQRKPSIVFVHGLWADGSCFSKLIPTLQNEGFEVIASQHGLDSHASDVDCVKRTLGRVINPAILVGHSRGALFFIRRHPICQTTSIDKSPSIYLSRASSVLSCRITAYSYGTLTFERKRTPLLMA